MNRVYNFNIKRLEQDVLLKRKPLDACKSCLHLRQQHFLQKSNSMIAVELRTLVLFPPKRRHLKQSICKKILKKQCFYLQYLSAFKVSAASNMWSTVTGRRNTPCDVFSRAERSSPSLPLNISFICLLSQSCRRLQRNVLKSVLQVQSYCFAHTLSLSSLLKSTRRGRRRRRTFKIF